MTYGWRPYAAHCPCQGTGVLVTDGYDFQHCPDCYEWDIEQWQMEHPHVLLINDDRNEVAWVDELMHPILRDMQKIGFTTYYSCQGDERVFDEIIDDSGKLMPPSGPGYLYGADDPGFVRTVESLIVNPIVSIERDPTYWDGSPGITVRWFGEVRRRNGSQHS